MQHAQSRAHSRRWAGRAGLASLACLIAFGIQPAVPALAGSWSSPVQLPGSCGSSVAVNRAGAMAAGGTFTAADGTTHVQVCTSPDGKTWQVADLGPGGNQPHGGPHPAVAVSPGGRVVALWGSAVGCPAACSYIVQASVRPPGGSWGAPVTLSTELNWGAGGADARHGRHRRRDRRLGRVLRRRQPLRRSPGRERELGPGPDAVDLRPGRCA
jgi:hypothetical protein